MIKRAGTEKHREKTWIAVFMVLMAQVGDFQFTGSKPVFLWAHFVSDDGFEIRAH